MGTQSLEPPDAAPVWFAWLVHLLTASGAALAFLALLAVETGQMRSALLWLGAALVIDGIDGPLARRAEVTRRLPGFDGALLDLVVDYLTYVFVPAILIYRAGLVLALYAPIAVAVILISSLYTFARRDMKTSDNYFRGFPALWNIIAFYLYLFRPGDLAGTVIVAVFAALTFAPIHFVHPLRVQSFQPWLTGVTALWGVSSLALLWGNWSDTWRHLLLATSLLCVCGLLAVGGMRTLRSRRQR